MPRFTGFKMAVKHHLDQPLMSVNEIDISPGFESQVPTVQKNITETSVVKHWN